MRRLPIFQLTTLAVGVATLVALAFTTVPADAADEEGVPVQVCVADTSANPIPTAVVRHPMEEERHRVNTVTGCWSANILYLPTGEDLKFVKGLELELEVSAPGYVSQQVRYIVRKRKNTIVVTLQDMQTTDSGSFDEPVIQFGRDRPLDGITPTAPPSDGQ